MELLAPGYESIRTGTVLTKKWANKYLSLWFSGSAPTQEWAPSLPDNQLNLALEDASVKLQ